MEVKDFLENFDGTNHIKIFDRSSFETRRYNSVKNAINDFGHFTIRRWTLESTGFCSDVLVITI